MVKEKQNTTVRREQIARAALQLIARRGLKGLSIAGIARGVGLVPSAIYRHFPGKEDVLDLVLDLIRQHLLANVEAVKAETDDPLDAMQRLLHRHVKLVRENEAIPMLVFSDQVYGGRPERKTKMHGIIQAYLGGVSELVRTGQKKRSIRADLDPQMAAVMFLGLIQPAVILWHLSDGGFDVTRQVERAWRLFEETLRPK